MWVEGDEMNTMTFKDVIAAATESAELDVEGAKIDFALELARLIESQGLSRAQFAQKLGVTKPMVTRILRGDSNLTIGTMVRAAHAAGGKLHLHIAPENQSVQWFNLIRGGQIAASPDGSARLASASRANPWHFAANDHETQSIAA